jgi:hypothetical protein
MQKQPHLPTTRLAALVLGATVLTGQAACDGDLDALAGVSQALGAEDAAAAAETGDDAASDDAASDDLTGEAPHDCDRERRDHGIAPPAGFEGVEIAACAPPIADGVDVGRPPHHRGHLAPLYDADESHSLDDAEQRQLIDDVTAGCTARSARLLADFDDDADGALSQAEWDAARQAMRDAHEGLRTSLDSDGDGEISPTEHEAARAALIATWDVDDSGDLDATERAALRADLQALVRAGDPLPPLPLLAPPGARGEMHSDHPGHGAHHGDHDGPSPPPPPGDDAGAGDDNAGA